MTLPSVLTAKLPTALFNVLGVGSVAFLLGENLGGLNGGVAGAIAGTAVAIIGQILSHRALMKRQKIDSAISLDQERDKVMDRSNKVHEAEITFMQRQVTYHEDLERTERNRLHAMVGEVQRCMAHIRGVEAFLIEHNFEPPKFQFKSFDEIVQMYPLPDPPTASSPPPE